jgi:hypothetical protein
MLRVNSEEYWCIAHGTQEVEVTRERQMTFWLIVKQDARLPEPAPWPPTMRERWHNWRSDEDDWDDCFED